MGDGKIPSLSIWKSVCTGNRSKPLEAILSKSLNQATPRLQHILIRTFPYHFKVRYIPGLTNYVADCLSRLGFQKDTISLPKLHVNQITSQLKARSNNLHDLRLATKDDDNLPFSNMSSNRDGQRFSKKFHPRYNPTGPSTRNLQ